MFFSRLDKKKTKFGSQNAPYRKTCGNDSAHTYLIIQTETFFSGEKNHTETYNELSSNPPISS